MRVLITGAAGNMGSLLARSLLGSGHTLRLMAPKFVMPEKYVVRCSSRSIL